MGTIVGSISKTENKSEATLLNSTVVSPINKVKSKSEVTLLNSTVVSPINKVKSKSEATLPINKVKSKPEATLLNSTIISPINEVRSNPDVTLLNSTIVSPINQVKSKSEAKLLNIGIFRISKKIRSKLKTALLNSPIVQKTLQNNWSEPANKVLLNTYNTNKKIMLNTHNMNKKIMLNTHNTNKKVMLNTHSTSKKVLLKSHNASKKVLLKTHNINESNSHTINKKVLNVASSHDTNEKMLHINNKLNLVSANPQILDFQKIRMLQKMINLTKQEVTKDPPHIYTMSIPVKKAIITQEMQNAQTRRIPINRVKAAIKKVNISLEAQNIERKSIKDILDNVPTRTIYIKNEVNVLKHAQNLGKKSITNTTNTQIIPVNKQSVHGNAQNNPIKLHHFLERNAKKIIMGISPQAMVRAQKEKRQHYLRSKERKQHRKIADGFVIVR